jgi:protein SCO1/2
MSAAIKTGGAVRRRSVMAGLAASLALRAVPALAHGSVGPIKPPLGVPDIEVVTSDGFRGPLRERLLGRVTAVQLMFTQCRSICPIEAATFARTQEALAGTASEGIQLLSLSIDPSNDTPEAMTAWLAGLGAGAGWTAAAPVKADLARARAFFDGVSDFGEDHSTAMSLMNRAGMLVWRTPELPAAEEVVRLLGHLQGERQDIATTATPGR